MNIGSWQGVDRELAGRVPFRAGEEILRRYVPGLRRVWRGGCGHPCAGEGGRAAGFFNKGLVDPDQVSRQGRGCD
jgi:hypothetical protein